MASYTLTFSIIVYSMPWDNAAKLQTEQCWFTDSKDWKWAMIHISSNQVLNTLIYLNNDSCTFRPSLYLMPHFKSNHIQVV